MHHHAYPKKNLSSNKHHDFQVCTLCYYYSPIPKPFHRAPLCPLNHPIKLNDLLNLKNTPELNKYKFEYEDGLLKLFFEDKLIQSANTNNPEETDLIIRELSQLENTIKGPNYLLKNEKFPFFDTTSSGEVINSISLINLETIKDFEIKLGKKIEHQRFRGNFYIEGMHAWEEKKNTR